MEQLTVGKLRQQTALCDADTLVELSLTDALQKHLPLGFRVQVQIINCYPDTRDGNGDWNHVFKIQLALKNTENFPT